MTKHIPIKDEDFKREVDKKLEVLANTLYVLAKRVESGAWDGLTSEITQWLELFDRTVEPERKTPKEKLIEEIALRIAYALPYSELTP